MKRNVAFGIMLALTCTVSAQFADLGESLVFVRTGFEESWTRVIPAVDDEAWIVAFPMHGESELRIRDVRLPGVPAGGRFSLLRESPVELTALIPFQADLTLLNASDPALFLKHVGQRWAVYLNGQLVRDELALAGSRPVERSLENVVVPLDKRLLRRGDNLLAFRIVGDPVDDKSGFASAGPYVIDSYRSLAPATREYLDLMFIGIYAFFALYHAVLFVLRPKDKGYLYFSALSLLFALFLAARTNIAPTIIANTAILRWLEYASLFLALPTALTFTGTLLWGRASRFVLGVALVSAAFAVAGLFLRLEPLLYAWIALCAVAAAQFLVFVLGKALARDYRALRTGSGAGAAGDEGRGVGASVAVLVLRSDSGQILWGVILLAAAGVADIVLATPQADALNWVKYAFFVFMLLTATVLARQFAAAADQAERMNEGLEAEVEARTAELSAAAAERRRLNEDVARANDTLTSAMRESERDVRIAAAVQKGFFPATAPVTRDWDVAFVFEPAAGISGDFYDFYESYGTLAGAVVGTVSGSGIASGLVTVLAKNIFSRQAADRIADPITTTFVEINRELVRELSAAGNTVSGLFLRLRGSQVEVVNASHGDMLLRRSDSGEVLNTTPRAGYSKAPPLGRDDYTADPDVIELSMRSGDALLAYTGGLVSSVNSKGVQYGAERLRAAFFRADPENADSLLASIMIDFRNYVAGSKVAADRTVMVLVKR
ncbi:MAG: SpoIIE family protein phosphatase [Spirochaetales bacterium]|nr:SpoIIE family protein phosphatase [Spirochaetales bacterium]